MIKVKAGNARNSRAIAKFSNAEIDYFGLKLIVHVLIRGSLNNNNLPGYGVSINTHWHCMSMRVVFGGCSLGRFVSVVTLFMC